MYSQALRLIDSNSTADAVLASALLSALDAAAPTVMIKIGGAK